MRPLTLHEKITFKGKLFTRSLRSSELVNLTMKSLTHYWSILYYCQPLINCFKRIKTNEHTQNFKCNLHNRNDN